MKKQNDTSEEIKRIFTAAGLDYENDQTAAQILQALGESLTKALHKRDEYWKGKIEGLRMEKIDYISQAIQESEGAVQPDPYNMGYESGCNATTDQLNTNIDTLLEENEK